MKTLLHPGQVMNYAIDVLGYSEDDFDEFGAVDEFWDSLSPKQKEEAIAYNS